MQVALGRVQCKSPRFEYKLGCELQVALGRVQYICRTTMNYIEFIEHFIIRTQVERELALWDGAFSHSRLVSSRIACP